MNFLTFDLGTTLYKVALFDDARRLLAIERVAPPIDRIHSDQWELHPVELFDCILAATKSLRLKAPNHWPAVEAISFATQANSFTLLDERHHPQLRLILWPDQRARDIADELHAVTRLPHFRQTTGMPSFGPLLGMAKLLWFRRNGLLTDRVREFCYLSDLVTHFFTGQLCTEAGVAGLSGAADIRQLNWWPAALEQLGIPQQWMPSIVRAGRDTGPLLPRIASAMGLSKDCRFIVGCLDQYAGAIGTGTVEPGRVCETTGTVLAAVRCDDALESDPPEGVYQGPGFDADRFFQMSFSSTSANLFEWYRNQLPNNPGFDELTALATSAPPSDVVIEPYDDRGPTEAAFRQVRKEHTPGQVVRAIMQRVAQSLDQQVQELCDQHRPAEIRSAGGAARNDYWLQMKADTLGIPFVAMECEEPTSLGAAMLAARAMGLGSLPELAQRWCRPRARFTPRASKV